MSREIKFKIWDIKNNCWLKEDSKAEYFLTKEGTIFSYYNDGSGGYDSDYHDKTELIPVFYTGLKDKNGKEVYEGDIVYSEKWNPSKQIIVFNDGAFCLDWGDSDYYNNISYIKYMEVIGNVHENQDLLNNQNN